MPVVPAPVATPGPAPSATAPRVPFHCSECGKSFRYRSDLRRHFARHTALKPHACPRCGKGFKHSFNLANHLRSHTGERPYRCSACPKGFRDSTGLLHHQVSPASHEWLKHWDSIPFRERQLEMACIVSLPPYKCFSTAPAKASDAHHSLQPRVYSSLHNHLENSFICVHTTPLFCNDHCSLQGTQVFKGTQQGLQKTYIPSNDQVPGRGERKQFLRK